ncbi:hypothetical protein HMPREF0872_00430 [Veillonella montpellierensis DNF00314]|uniref:Uncharacterized protein n=2 Tax=Veillonella montpellierensis TaxID=187328 RepID=A0A096CRY2_9FIRM|nr:hypothetical protein HMPREF0872_00430 [Veillonella montpellierensis DNF00314]
MQLVIEFNELNELKEELKKWNEVFQEKPCCKCKSVAEEIEDTATTKRKRRAKTEEKPKVEEKPAEEVKAVPTVEETPTVNEVPIVDFTEEKQPEKMDTPVEEIDVTPFDPKAFWAELLTWMGKDGQRATNALKIFRSHGIEKPSSSQLTDDIVNELKALMA